MKYQLTVYRKDGSASGRVVDIAWCIDLKNVKRVTLSEAEEAPTPPPASHDECENYFCGEATCPTTSPPAEPSR